MGLRTSISVLVAGLVLALAVTARVDRVELSALGWSLVVGAVLGLLISAVQRVRRQPYAEWYAIGPWLLIIGLVATQAITLPAVPGIDLFTVGSIVLALGIGITLAAIYVVSPLRLSSTMRSYWRSPADDDPPDPTAYRHQPHQQSYEPPQPGYDDRRSTVRYDDREPPTQQLPRQ